MLEGLVPSEAVRDNLPDASLGFWCFAGSLWLSLAPGSISDLCLLHMVFSLGACVSPHFTFL